jgi:hypothetical protein
VNTAHIVKRASIESFGKKSMSKSPSHRSNTRSKTVDNGAIRNINLKKQLGNKFSRPI